MRGPEGSPEPQPLPAGRWWWLAILSVALLARLAFVALAPNEWQFRDSIEYGEMARSLYEHGTYGLQTLRAPGYPTLIAAGYLVFGPHLLPLRLMEALLGVLSVALIGAVGTRAFGRGPGLISAGLAALHPVLAFLPTIQYAENTLVLAVVLACGATFEAWRRGELWRWAASGVLWGLALLVRPNTLLVLPGLSLGLVLALHRERRAWWAPALVGIAACVLTVTPWIVRNHRVHGEWYFIATGGGRQLWIGNNPRAEADSRIAGFYPDSMILAETKDIANEVELERYFYRKGLAYMQSHPGRAVVLYLRELRNLFALYPETTTRRYITVLSRLAQGVVSAVVFAGALMALVRFRSEPGLWALTGAVVSFALGSTFFFTIMRYRMTVEPCLLWMAGVGWDMVRSRRLRPPAVAQLRTAGA